MAPMPVLPRIRPMLASIGEPFDDPYEASQLDDGLSDGSPRYTVADLEAMLRFNDYDRHNNNLSRLLALAPNAFNNNTLAARCLDHASASCWLVSAAPSIQTVSVPA